jgi:hypothetical protein
MGHRVIRHNRESVEKLREAFGDEVARAAEIHIEADEGRVMSREKMDNIYKWDWQKDVHDLYPGSPEPTNEINLATWPK